MTQHRGKSMLMLWVFPGWWLHCAPQIFDVSFYAGQRMVSEWGGVGNGGEQAVEDLWSTLAFKTYCSLKLLRSRVPAHPSLLWGLTTLTILSATLA